MSLESLFHPTVAFAEQSRAIVLSTGAAQHQSSFAAGLDRRWELVLVTEGAVTGTDMLPTCGSDGLVVRLRVHTEWSRVDGRRLGKVDQLLSVCFTC